MIWDAILPMPSLSKSFELMPQIYIFIST